MNPNANNLLLRLFWLKAVSGPLTAPSKELLTRLELVTSSLPRTRSTN
jgi:hypothetical protein